MPRLARNDRAALRECVDTYQDLIWTISEKFTFSKEETEREVLAIFRDIRKYAGDFINFDGSEIRFITYIACRRLFRLAGHKRVLTVGTF
ncbi:MAG: hypothetical protein R2747_07510 [Pyrinomonadaceae bacterium]